MKFWQNIKRAARRYYTSGGSVLLILLFFVSVLFIVPGQSKSTSHQSGAPLPAPAIHFSSLKPLSLADVFAASPSWSQDFTAMNNGSLNNSVWGYDLGNGGPDNPGWGNNENEYYTNSPNNARIENGQLIIEARQQSAGGFNYTSARITTVPSLNFTYGKLDIIAKLPAGCPTLGRAATTTL